METAKNVKLNAGLAFFSIQSITGMSNICAKPNDVESSVIQCTLLLRSKMEPWGVVLRCCVTAPCI